MHFHYPQFRISTVLFQCHGKHQCPVRGPDRRCCACSLSSVCSFFDLARPFTHFQYTYQFSRMKSPHRTTVICILFNKTIFTTINQISNYKMPSLWFHRISKTNYNPVWERENITLNDDNLCVKLGNRGREGKLTSLQATLNSPRHHGEGCKAHFGGH